MEPLFPESGVRELVDLGTEIFKKSGELEAALPSLIVRAEVAKLVREMNSYYSNLIEGHKTLPRDIERALRGEFSDRKESRRNQDLSLAHINAEISMREVLEVTPATDVFSSEFICWLHRKFYSHLPQAEWFTDSKTGKRYPVEPGRIRSYNVDIGSHMPPDHNSLGEFMERFQQFYSDEEKNASWHLVALAAAHHRLAWLHPFGDGNGRVARLQSQAGLIALGLDGEGLWTLSRGLAREKQSYYKSLQQADQNRMSDFDGRGNLSDKGLAEFCRFFFERTLDQMDFMTGLVSPLALIERIESYFRFVRLDLDSRMRERLARLLKVLVMEGEIARGGVSDILGLKGTAAREVIRKAADEGLVGSYTEKGPLRVSFPNKVVEYYFPNLFTDLPER